MAFDDAGDDGEAEPGAGVVEGSGVVEAGEALEDGLTVVGGDAGSVVGDHELDLVVVFAEAEADLAAILRQAPSEAGGSSTRPQAYGLTGPIRLVPYGEAPVGPPAAP